MIRIKQTKLTSAVCAGSRVLLLSGLTFLLGSCQWLGLDDETETQTKKEEKIPEPKYIIMRHFPMMFKNFFP